MRIKDIIIPIIITVLFSLYSYLKGYCKGYDNAKEAYTSFYENLIQKNKDTYEATINELYNIIKRICY